MLRNRRGATSLRWLRQLLDHGIEVHGQIVVCPGVNDGAVLHETFAGILERFPELASAAAVPLGVSRFSKEAAMRSHSRAEAEAVVDAVAAWQERFLWGTGRRLVHAADEYYLLAGRSFPPAAAYEDFPQVENGVGMARSFEASFLGRRQRGGDAHASGGFFQSVDGAPATGYRAVRDPAALTPASGPVHPRGRRRDGEAPRPVTILTGEYGARVLRPLLDGAGHGDVGVVAVRNGFFGGNIAVAGLITGADLSEALAELPTDRRYLVPDVCLSEGRFLDGTTVAELPRAVEVVPADGASLRRALAAVPRRERAGAGASATGPVAAAR
jgi:NifB/MoaA-like Fe-S oxidoreductase